MREWLHNFWPLLLMVGSLVVGVVYTLVFIVPNWKPQPTPIQVCIDKGGVPIGDGYTLRDCKFDPQAK